MVNDNSLVGLGGAMLAVIVIWSLVGLLIFVWYLWSMARLFPYLGLPAAHGWIPVFNQWRLIERGGYPGWLILLAFIPGVNIVAVVFLILAIHRINSEHGEGAGMTVLGALIAPLWATLLGSRLRDRGQMAGAAGGVYAPQAGGWQAPQQNPVEYGPDGRAYPTLGEAAPAAGFADQGYAAPGQAHQGYADQAYAAPGYAPPHTFAEQTPAPQDSGWAMPPVPQNALDPAAFAPPGSPAPSAPESWAPPAPPAQPQVPGQPGASAYAAPTVPGMAPGETPVQDNPWSLGSTVDGNFERLANEAIPPRDGGFSGGVDARPFSWPEPQPAESFAPAAPTVPAAPQVPAAPAMPAAPPVVEAPAVAEAPAVQAAPPAAPAGDISFSALFSPPAPPELSEPTPAPVPVAVPEYEDEIGATVVTGGAVAPIAADEDLDHTVVVSRTINWVLELPDGTTLDLAGDDIVLGRRPSSIDGSATMLVPDSSRTLSKSHARMRRFGDVWTIEDLNSTNGVFVFDTSGAQIELTPGTPHQASEHLIIGTLEVRLRAEG